MTSTRKPRRFKRQHPFGIRRINLGGLEDIPQVVGETSPTCDEAPSFIGIDEVVRRLLKDERDQTVELVPDGEPR